MRINRAASRTLRIIGMVVSVLLVGGLAPPAARAELGGFRFVGRLAENSPHLTDADGSLYLDTPGRRAYTFYRGSGSEGDYLELRSFDLDRIENGFYKELAPYRIKADQVTPVNGDRSRLSIDSAAVERVAAMDESTGRLLYSADGALYEIDLAKRALHKFVAAPHPGGVDEGTAYSPSGTGLVTFPSGMSFQQTPQGPRAYMVGSFRPGGNGAWLSGWDARPSTGPETVPEQRQLWYYPVRTCQSLNLGDTQSTVFRARDYLYMFCDGSTDGSSVGVLRIHLASVNGGEPIPDGQEELFPGVTGIEVGTKGDPATERMYITSSNAAGGRSTLVFDGRASDGRGAYIGQVALSDADRPPIGTGLNPKTGRWYFDSPEGLWYQDGRLRRLAQAVRIDKDSRGKSLGGGNNRPIGVDYGRNPPRVFVQREGFYEVFEDTSALPGEALPPTERTNGEPESASNVGIYTGVTSAYGERLRFMRGMSTLWPSGTGYSLEAPAGDNRTAPNFYTSDPFFYHAGDCGTHDREVAVGRILATELSGGLTERTARAAGMAVDPEMHRRSTPDETLTRDDIADPEPCTATLLTAMTGSPPPRAGLGSLVGTKWPYDRVDCAGQDDKSTSTSSPLAGSARVTCDAEGDKPSVTAATQTALSPTDPNLLVAVQNVLTSTKTVRVPGEGVTATSTAMVKGITIAGLVHIDQLLVSAEAHAGGRSGTATRKAVRQFSGVTVGSQSICAAVCDQAQVVEQINRAIGGIGYVRVADPEPDFTLGTKQGTLAVVQKNLLQQDADNTTNRDDSSEWPGLEIGVYRDAQQRGGGRWILQLGGVFAQAQFGVIDGLGDGSGGGGSDEVLTTTIDASAAFRSPVITSPPAPPKGVIPRIIEAAGKVFKQVLSGIGFALTNPFGAALLGTLWCLVCAPAYLATRRRLLTEVTRL